MSINKIVSGRVAVLFVSLAGISGTYAADGTLHATGDVTNSTCAVDVAGTTAQFGTIDNGDYKYDETRPVKTGPYAVGADFRSHLMDVGLYRQYGSTLTYGDIKYDVNYTVDFL
ncbi:hypothetical protein [Enterobacter kobei]|uniref:hypothetical protein n=1 Tax=Enterobacter kobei TaxID=208224 RepID=UPI003CF2560C